MSVREVAGPAGVPWERPLAGSLDRLVVESDALADNPLGDPARRPLYVYRPPGVGPQSPRRLPSIYVLQGFFGQLTEWLARTSSGPTPIERLDALFAEGSCPPAVIVFVDAWTARGGSQFLNSTSTGRYLDYLCDEIVPFVDSRYPTSAHRGICGKSSGGYGALAVSMLRPGLFAALASQAGDALFECCYQPLFPQTARILRDHFDGSWDAFLKHAESAERLDDGPLTLLAAAYGTACAFTPDPARPGKALMPFDSATGRLIEDVWARWLQLDPVRMAEHYADPLRSMRRIRLEAGRSDEFFLDLGARALSAELSRLGIEHVLEEFDGAHADFAPRQPAAIRDLVLALDGA